MFRFCFALSAFAVLSLGLCSSTARADITVTNHADGTSTMVTNYGPGDRLNHTTEFDANGNVIRITWDGPPKTIAEYDAFGNWTSQTEVNNGITTTKIPIRNGGAIIGYWITVFCNGIPIRHEVQWLPVGLVRGPVQNGNCVPAPPVPPGKTYSKDKHGKCQAGSKESETRSVRVGAAVRGSRTILHEPRMENSVAKPLPRVR